MAPGPGETEYLGLPSIGPNGGLSFLTSTVPMGVKECAAFVVRNVGQPPDESPKMRIRHDPGSRLVDPVGAVLEAQFKSGGRYVQFVFEETSRCFLPDGSMSKESWRFRIPPYMGRW